METPLALIIFNRPRPTEKVFREIAKVRPRKFFVIADGPRPDHPSDAEACAETRAIIERVDWPCEVLKNYSEVNLGCGQRPHTGIDWVFKQVDKCIILEDDCVPDPSFFPFCEELLEKYYEDERVMHISGRGVFPNNPTSRYSYYFSHSLSCWGWATWARAWRYYDKKVSIWPELRDTPWLENIFGNERISQSMKKHFDRFHDPTFEVNTWDMAWLVACWSQNGLGIRPYSNLITNIGFDEGATHKQWAQIMKMIDVPTSSVRFPLQHPPFVVRDITADQFTIDRQLKAESKLSRRRWYRRQLERISHILPDKIRNSIKTRLTIYLENKESKDAVH